MKHQGQTMSETMSIVSVGSVSTAGSFLLRATGSGRLRRRSLPTPSIALLCESFPEPNGVVDPSFGARTSAEPEAMAQVLELMILDLSAALAQGRDTPFHCGSRRDAILLTDLRSILRDGDPTDRRDDLPDGRSGHE